MMPSALEAFDTIKQQIASKQLALFLDYDGTLAPISGRPELAQLSETMRSLLEKLARQYPVGIISGRELKSLRDTIAVEGLYYAGNHGFEIEGPDHKVHHEPLNPKYTDAIQRAYEQLEQRLKSVEKAWVENKTLTLSVHYRAVTEDHFAEVEAIVDDVMATESCLKKYTGKRVFEIRPQLDWHKGKALLRLLEAMHMDPTQIVPLYIGDDVTDEDAFQAIADRGIGILVAETPRDSHARFWLKCVDEVQQFLNLLLNELR